METKRQRETKGEAGRDTERDRGERHREKQREWCRKRERQREKQRERCTERDRVVRGKDISRVTGLLLDLFLLLLPLLPSSSSPLQAIHPVTFLLLIQPSPPLPLTASIPLFLLLFLPHLILRLIIFLLGASNFLSGDRTCLRFHGDGLRR